MVGRYSGQKFMFLRRILLFVAFVSVEAIFFALITSFHSTYDCDVQYKFWLCVSNCDRSSTISNVTQKGCKFNGQIGYDFGSRMHYVTIVLNAGSIIAIIFLILSLSRSNLLRWELHTQVLYIPKTGPVY